MDLDELLHKTDNILACLDMTDLTIMGREVSAFVLSVFHPLHNKDGSSKSDGFGITTTVFGSWLAIFPKMRLTLSNRMPFARFSVTCAALRF